MQSDGRPVSTLHDYLRVLRRRKWIILPAVVVAPIVAALISLRTPVRYEASAQVLVNRQNLAANLTGVSDPTQQDSPRFLTTQSQFARLPIIARRTLAAAGMTDASPSDLLGSSRVTSTDNSDFLTFTVSDPRRARAILLATTYAQEYAAYHREFERDQLGSARRAVVARINGLENAGDTSSSLYRSLLQQEDQLATMEAVASSRQALVRDATGAALIPAHVARNAIIAFVLALITAVGLAFLRDALDVRVRSADEVGDHLQLRLLGRLPEPPRALRKAKKLVMLEAPESPYAEPFRMLRTSLEFVTTNSSSRRRPGAKLVFSELEPQHGQRLMVTSALEGEGKTTTVANLAVAFARAGRRVLLVDFDFRRAALHRFFDLESRPGLSDVVHGEVSLENAISYVDLDVVAQAGASDGKPTAERTVGSAEGSLGVVPSGILPVHADDTIVTARIEQILRELGTQADLVLIDSPPLLRVGDALELTSYVDALLVIANLRAIRPPILDELHRVLADIPADKLGFVLTGADIEGGYEYLTYAYHRVANAS